MNKTYQGNVSIYGNTVGKVVVKGDPEGQYNQGNVDELVKVMIDVAHANKLQCNFFIPEGKQGDKGLTPVLLSGRGGQPYVAFLPERKGANQPRKQVVKLG